MKKMSDENKWIPVKEALPKESGQYIVTYHPCYWDDVKNELVVGMDSFIGKEKWAKRKYQRSYEKRK